MGDVLKVGPGDQIVLDGKLLDGKMQVDESQLTGESNLIPKQAGDAVYSGSFCVNGSALFVVEKVGTQSLANEITAGARAFKRVLTPLQNEVYLVVRVMLVIVIYLEFLMFLNSIINDIAASESIADATLVVGLVPNGLFLSISVAYALGAVRIIRFGALVQQSNAIESLSNVDVLCLDKTGTLTANRLKVDDVYPIDFDKAELQHASRRDGRQRGDAEQNGGSRRRRVSNPIGSRSRRMCRFRRRASGAPWRIKAAACMQWVRRKCCDRISMARAMMIPNVWQSIMAQSAS